MSTAFKVYAMLGNRSLWEAAEACHDLLDRGGVVHAIAGGVAVCLHGYQRNTVDLDILVPPQQAAAVRGAFEPAGIMWSEEHAEYRTPEGIAVHFLEAGERAGKGSDVLLPDPTQPHVVVAIDGLPVLSLAKLIEAKIACGQANLRRTHKDFADVVELIATHGLGRDFARQLHKSVREAYRQLVVYSRAE